MQDVEKAKLDLEKVAKDVLSASKWLRQSRERSKSLSNLHVDLPTIENQTKLVKVCQCNSTSVLSSKCNDFAILL